MREIVPTTPKSIQEAADAALGALSPEELALKNAQIKEKDKPKKLQDGVTPDVVPIFGGIHFSS